MSWSSIRPARDTRAGNHVVHAVQRAQESRLAATRWTNEGHHNAFGNLDRDVVQRLHAAVEEIQIANSDFRLRRVVPAARRADAVRELRIFGGSV